MTDNPLRILLVEDDWSVRRAVNEYLTNHNMVMAEADSLEETLQIIETFIPNIAILDIVLPEKKDQRADFQKHIGVEIARLLKQRFPQVGIIFLSAFIDRGPEVVQMFMEGHTRITYLLKGSKPQELLDAIQRLGNGGSWLDLAPGVLSQRNSALKHASEHLTMVEKDILFQALEALPSLSVTEQKVFDAIGRSLTRRQAALDLNLSPKTISSHMEAIYDRLNLRTIPAGMNQLSLMAKLHMLKGLSIEQKKDDS